MKPLFAFDFHLARLEEHQCHMYFSSASMTATTLHQLAAATPSGSMPFSVMVEECFEHDQVQWFTGAAPMLACH